MLLYRSKSVFQLLSAGFKLNSQVSPNFEEEWERKGEEKQNQSQTETPEGFYAIQQKWLLSLMAWQGDIILLVFIECGAFLEPIIYLIQFNL